MSLLSLILLPLFVYLSEKILPDEYKMLDKYIAGIISAGVTATVGFFGNKKITFKQ
jgi:putative flippase GtrA